jgi:hypothetical protein
MIDYAPVARAGYIPIMGSSPVRVNLDDGMTDDRGPARQLLDLPTPNEPDSDTQAQQHGQPLSDTTSSGASVMHLASPAEFIPESAITHTNLFVYLRESADRLNLTIFVHSIFHPPRST